MYRCSECGCEFENKPQYCDCGNDTFEEIVSSEQKEPEKETQPSKKEDYRDYSVLKKNLPSIIFLIFCAILSFIILFFIGNSKDEPEAKEHKQTETIKRNIPDIDKLWNDEKPKQVQQIQKSEPPKEEKIEIKQEVPKVEPKITKVELKKEPAKKVNKPVTQPVVQKVQNKPQQTQQKTQQTQKSQQVQTKPAQQTQKPQQTQTQTQTTQPTQQKPVSTTSSQTTQPITVQPQQTQTQQTQAPKQVNTQELKEYKKALRNKIASNIDFLSIAGDGKCSLSFNISSSGALLNRKFVSQSQNSSLNDAVYAGMLKVSSYKTPPAAYKNETLRLTVQISGGNFSVSLE